MSKVPIVDAVVAYNFPYSGKTYLLVMINALYIKGMKHHHIPPFILIEEGLTVSNVPKLYCDESTIEDYSIYDDKTKL